MEINKAHQNDFSIPRNARIVRPSDLAIALILQGIDEYRPRWPRIDFRHHADLAHQYLLQVREYARQNLPQLVGYINHFINWLFPNESPRMVKGPDTLKTDLFQFKKPYAYDDTDTDDAISVGYSTIAASEKMRTADLEQELAKIKDNMSSVFEAKLESLQSTINSQLEIQREMQAKMNEMMEHIKTTNLSSSVMTPLASSAASTAKIPPPAPPLPVNFQTPQTTKVNQVPKFNQTPKADQGRANLMESIRQTGGFANSCLKSVENNTVPKTVTKKLSSPEEKKPQNNSNALGYDYRDELAIQLQKRRQAIEKIGGENYDPLKTERANKPSGNPIVSSMMQRIPVSVSSPNSPRLNLTNGNISYCTDEEEWS